MRSLKLKYLFLFVSSIGLGLASRSGILDSQSFLGAYSGDAIWAMMVYWMFRILFTSKGAKVGFLMALVFSFAIEFSQLYQADWINSIRANRLGALVLGHGFLWSDLLCYSVGIMIGFGIDQLIFNKNKAQ